MRQRFAIIMTILGLLAVPAFAPAFAKESKMSTDPKVAVVQNMIEAWNTRNWPLVDALFTEDGVLHSMMIEPLVGRKAIDARISAMGAGISEITLKLRGIPQSIAAGSCSFKTVEGACNATIMAIQTGIPLARIELLNAAQVAACNAYSKLTLPETPLLLLEFHHNVM